MNQKIFEGTLKEMLARRAEFSEKHLRVFAISEPCEADAESHQGSVTELTEPEVVYKNGILVVRAKAMGDLNAVIEKEREHRLDEQGAFPIGGSSYWG